MRLIIHLMIRNQVVCRWRRDTAYGILLPCSLVDKSGGAGTRPPVYTDTSCNQAIVNELVELATRIIIKRHESRLDPDIGMIIHVD